METEATVVEPEVTEPRVLKYFRCECKNNEARSHSTKAHEYIVDKKANSISFIVDNAEAKDPIECVVATLRDVDNWVISTLDPKNIKQCPHCGEEIL